LSDDPVVTWVGVTVRAPGPVTVAAESNATTEIRKTAVTAVSTAAPQNPRILSTCQR
jgi:phosphoribosyl-dephospho-CoA transferase